MLLIRCKQLKVLYTQQKTQGEPTGQDIFTSGRNLTRIQTCSLLKMPSNIKTLSTSPLFMRKHPTPPWARKRLWHHNGFGTQKQVLPWRLQHYFFLTCSQVQEAAQHLCQTAVLLCCSLVREGPWCDTALGHRQGQNRKAPAWVITVMLHWAVETCSLTLPFPHRPLIPDTLSPPLLKSLPLNQPAGFLKSLLLACYKRVIIRRIFKFFFLVLSVWTCPDPQIFTSSFAVPSVEWWWMQFQPHFIYPSDRQQYKLSLEILVVNQEAMWSGKCSTGQGLRGLDCHFIFLYLAPIIYSVHKVIRSLLTVLCISGLHI